MSFVVLEARNSSSADANADEDDECNVHNVTVPVDSSKFSSAVCIADRSRHL